MRPPENSPSQGPDNRSNKVLGGTRRQFFLAALAVLAGCTGAENPKEKIATPPAAARENMSPRGSEKNPAISVIEEGEMSGPSKDGPGEVFFAEYHPKHANGVVPIVLVPLVRGPYNQHLRKKKVIDGAIDLTVVTQNGDFQGEKDGLTHIRVPNSRLVTLHREIFPGRYELDSLIQVTKTDNNKDLAARYKESLGQFQQQLAEISKKKDGKFIVSEEEAIVIKSKLRTILNVPDGYTLRIRPTSEGSALDINEILAGRIEDTNNNASTDFEFATKEGVLVLGTKKVDVNRSDVPAILQSLLNPEKTSK